jgi:hypothetical protein
MESSERPVVDYEKRWKAMRLCYDTVYGHLPPMIRDTPVIYASTYRIYGYPARNDKPPAENKHDDA